MDLVYLSNEEFPRLRAGGRLCWLGRHGAAPNYHDPEMDHEVVWENERATEPTRLIDPSEWCPPLPDGVCVLGTLAQEDPQATPWIRLEGNRKY